MRHEFVAVPDEEVPQAADPLFQHLVTTYLSETNKTAGMRRGTAGRTRSIAPGRPRPGGTRPRRHGFSKDMG